MSRGKFITFEGGEGVGKTTQIKHLAKYLEGQQIECLQTREPGGSDGAEAVRHVLLSGAADALGVGASGEAILFAAARADHVDTTIRPALDEGKWVLCDRFMDSTRVYQGEHEEVVPSLVNLLERIAIDGLRPDLTIILDLDAEIGLSRADERREDSEQADRFERETLQIHENRRNAFLKLAQDDPDRCKIVDASQDIEKIAADIWQIVQKELLLSGEETSRNEQADTNSKSAAQEANANPSDGSETKPPVPPLKSQKQAEENKEEGKGQAENEETEEIADPFQALQKQLGKLIAESD